MLFSRQFTKGKKNGIKGSKDHKARKMAAGFFLVFFFFKSDVYYVLTIHVFFHALFNLNSFI